MVYKALIFKKTLASKINKLITASSSYSDSVTPSVNALRVIPAMFVKEWMARNNNLIII